MTTIELTVYPSRTSGVRGPDFATFVEGHVLIVSPTPFFDAARALIAMGRDPAARYVMRYRGSDAVVFSSTLGEAAKLTVEEGERRPVIRKYKPRPTTAGGPPMRPKT